MSSVADGCGGEFVGWASTASGNVQHCPGTLVYTKKNQRHQSDRLFSLSLKVLPTVCNRTSNFGLSPVIKDLKGSALLRPVSPLKDLWQIPDIPVSWYGWSLNEACFGDSFYQLDLAQWYFSHAVVLLGDS